MSGRDKFTVEHRLYWARRRLRHARRADSLQSKLSAIGNIFHFLETAEAQWEAEREARRPRRGPGS